MSTLMTSAKQRKLTPQLRRKLREQITWGLERSDLPHGYHDFYFDSYVEEAAHTVLGEMIADQTLCEISFAGGKTYHGDPEKPSIAYWLTERPLLIKGGDLKVVRG